MINCSCLIQEGQSPDLNKVEMHAAIQEFATRSFGLEAQIVWIPVAAGDGFTAGKPSTSSVVSITSNEKLDPAPRESLLREFVTLWTNKTGSTSDEIVAVIADPTET
ncbi:MAG: hypothetical protein MI746_18020 [Pseudomonadales bacterium]|nr:hypothetical protein [Pseudomonadales bacterium]